MSAASQSSRLDSKVVSEVVKSLKDYTSKKKTEENKGSKGKGGKADLFDDVAGGGSSPIFAQVQLVKDVVRKVARPVRVKIPHSLYFPEEFDHSICLFCRSSDKQEIEILLGNNKSANVTKIISLDEVKTVYKRFEDKKALLKQHSHFVCDARIMSHLYNLLGKVFAVNNHYPVPIDFEKVDSKLLQSIHKVIHDSTFMFIKGQTINIRLGYTFMSDKEVTSNILSGLEFAVPKLKDEWKSVHSIWLKTATSSAMPIYSKDESKQLKFIKKLIDEADKSKGGSKDKSGKSSSGSGKSSSSSSSNSSISGGDAIVSNNSSKSSSSSKKDNVPEKGSKASAASTPAGVKTKGLAVATPAAATTPIATTTTTTTSSSVGKKSAAKAEKSATKIISKSSSKPTKAAVAASSDVKSVDSVSSTPSAKSTTFATSTISSAKKSVGKSKTPK